MLLWPIPWKYTLPPLFDPLQIRGTPEPVLYRYDVDKKYKLLRSLPIFRWRDTPLCSLYRLHDFIAADITGFTMLEGNYFFSQAEWQLKDIPDPQDTNPVQYAPLACIVEAMVAAYNRKTELGLRRSQ
jgi:hypothetical protein